MKEYKPMKSLNKIMNYVLPNCKEVAELTSCLLDESLPIRKRIGLKLHLTFCKFCRRNYEQLYLIRKLVREKLTRADTVETDSKSRLSEESRHRISATLQKAK